jgi:HlyD family secretion protein
MTDKNQFGRHLLTLAALSAVLGGLGVVGCGRKPEQAEDQQKAAAAKVAAIATQVSVVTAQQEAISETNDVTGTLNAENDVLVSTKLGGRITGVFFREGDRVTQGQIIAQQDTADAQAQLDQQRANLASARTRLAQAEVAYRNAQTTLNWTGDQTASAVKSAQAALKVAQEQLAVLKSGARPQERQQAEENVAAAKADQVKARADLKRYQELYRQQAISAQQLDQAQAIADSADARYNSAVQASSLVKEGARTEDIRRAEAQVEQARQGVVTARSNREQVTLRRADVENARAGIDSAKAGVKQAEAAVRLAEQALADLTIRSPMTGVVAERKAEPGVQASATRSDVMRIIALDSIYFDAQLSETQYARIRQNQTVAVTVDAFPGRTFQGRVSKIFPVASATARSFTVRISITNDGNMLRPSMFARGQITLQTNPNAIVVPREVVLDQKGSEGKVFVVENGQAKSRNVKLGISTIRTVEITEGVKAGEQVVSTGQAQLTDGDKVEVIKTTASAAP